MATTTSIVTPQKSSASVALWVAWARVIDDFLKGIGWERTADSGQIDFDSPPGAVGTAYFLLKPADDLLFGTFPYILRFEVTGTTAKVGIGTGSDGSGNLTGSIGTARFFSKLQSDSGNSYDWILAGDVDWFAVGTWRSATAAYGGFLAVERSRDGDGAVTGDFVTVLTLETGGSVYERRLLSNGGGGEEAHPACSLLPYQGGSAFGGYKPASPLYPFMGRASNPMKSCGIAPLAAVADQEVVPLSLYGETIDYYGAEFGTTVLSSGCARILIRWE